MRWSCRLPERALCWCLGFPTGRLVVLCPLVNGLSHRSAGGPLSLGVWAFTQVGWWSPVPGGSLAPSCFEPGSGLPCSCARGCWWAGCLMWPGTKLLFSELPYRVTMHDGDVWQL